MKIQTITTNLSGTHKLGELIGKNLKGNETFALMGGLGSGKTSFTQGLAKGLGIKDNITSPTFVLERIYEVPKRKFNFHHFDLYRTGSNIRGIGLLDVLGDVVTAIEWPEKIKKYLPDDTIWVEIKYQSEKSRGFMFKFPETKKYIFKNTKSCGCS
ncbi:tRNA (adenosine(37)-N6)-threonylcarbamoyltransferase complex ATPase subunit type 1 TsaE [candidate division Kazan bacterium]|uniref:tRNA threonylcarbamoyladenosine biosynthesis protein TsaE n=1 Tax=candidate division Kazan bacterium TaxID=2202143 RepID=A0A420ZDJ2_UNCK3|nr:MAG: tRNA (adenosine(37)-N6)-threonylcarbamoyltransferase complex ATPase subunit type 1 TsaE [candidate division Kazan bacterium]